MINVIFKKHLNHNDKFVDICPKPPYIGKKPTDTCLFMVEGFIKEDIALTKTCGCEHCCYRRKMFRAIQGIIKQYKIDHPVK